MKQRGMPVFAVFSAAALFLSSCAADMHALRREYVRANPALTNQTKNAIINGEVIKGMTRDEVAASWGRPVSIARDSDGVSPPRERWTYLKELAGYTNVQEVIFVDGRAREVEFYGQGSAYQPLSPDNVGFSRDN